MDPQVAKEFDTHLAEYSALRGEITQYNQRIDRTVGVYLSALVGLAGYLLRPESTFDLHKYVDSIATSPSQASLMLILGILNGLLFLRLQSFFLAVLAMSQYTATVIGPRCSALLGSDYILRWDSADVVRAKKYWIPSRSVSQFGFGAVAISLSFGAMVLGLSQATQSIIVAALLITLIVLLIYSLYTTWRIVDVSENFLEVPANLLKCPRSEPHSEGPAAQENGDPAPNKMFESDA